METLRKIVEMVVKEGFQIHPDLFRFLSTLDESSLRMYHKRISKVIKEKRREGRNVVLRIEDLEEREEERKVEVWLNVIFDVSKHINPIGNYDSLFLSRFEKFQRIWGLRSGPKELVEIGFFRRVRSQRPRLIGGFVMDKRVTGSKVLLKLEDLSGEIEVEASMREFSEVDEVVKDSFIVLEVEHGERGFTAKNVMLLDLPNKRLRTVENDLYVAALSDLHIGSRKFKEDLFLEIINWLSSSENEIGKKLCCVFFLGDIISFMEGIRTHYSKFFTHLRKLPPSMHKVVIPGECDATRIALPQPSISSYYLIGSGEVPNLHLLGNPSYVSVNGIKFLCFHGQSLDDIALQVSFGTSVEPARLGRVLLKHRHLAPTYGGRTLIAPDKEDLLVISEIPDVFLIGHVHHPSEDFYKNVLILTTSSLTSDTSLEKGRLTLINLKNLEVSWMF